MSVSAIGNGLLVGGLCAAGLALLSDGNGGPSLILASIGASLWFWSRRP